MVEAEPLSSVHPVGKPLEFTISKLGLASRPAGQKPAGVVVRVGVAVRVAVDVAVGVAVSPEHVGLAPVTVPV